jgi:hypothetical protein
VPLARTEDLVTEELDDELLVYDQRTNEAHCLGATATRVWRACDGRASSAELSKRLGLDSEMVARALEELASCQLLDLGPAVGVTRREATAKMMKVSAAVASAPLIYSIVAPTPALAASQNFCVGMGCMGPGCAVCFKAGCACCGEGTSGSTKLCTADCTCANCSSTVIHNHCGGSGTESGCTSGPNHLPHEKDCG